MRLKFKFLAAMTMLVAMMFAGCLKSKDSIDSASGVNLVREGNTVTVLADSSFEGAVINISGDINPVDIKFVNGNIGIVNKSSEGTVVSVVAPNGDVKSGDELFKIDSVNGVLVFKAEQKVKASEADKESKKYNTTRAAGDILIGDFDADGVVGLSDFNLFSAGYVASYAVKYDISPALKASSDSKWTDIYSKSTPDGKIDIFDFIIFGRNYGKTNPDVTVSSVTIAPATATVETGKTVSLVATVAYSNGATDTSGADVVWTTSNSAAATVSAGTVTGVAAGTSTITATKDGKSGTSAVTVTDVDTSIKIYYKASSAPTIWFWEDGDRAILKLEGLTWDTQPTMTASATASGWYEYTIPAKYYPLTKRLGVMFNKGAAVFTTGIPTASVWYDGTNWYDKNPDGPKAPTIALSGAGTFVAGTYNVTVNVSGDSITAIKYTKDGSTPSATNGTTVANGGTIPVTLTTGSTVTVKVYAENAVGSTTAEAVLKEGQPVKAGFSWRNALVYFVLTDRFYNGDKSNDNSYNRKNSSDIPSVATFHGGDIKGVTEKLDYLDSLGVNAIWITAPYEQMHGWVSGKNNAFPHYAFHGYYAQDWTFMDKNMGTVEEFRTFVNEAHERGIRVVMDIVMNHTAYNTTEDMITYGFGKTSQTEHGWIAQTDGKWNANAGNDWESSDWGKWWSGWARGFGGKFGFGQEGNGALKGSLAGLPDVMTESTSTVSIPQFLKTKWEAENNSSYDNWRIPAASDLRQDNLGAPADYIVKWLASWVEEFGVDGFRCDTAKHVDMYRWKQLKDECKQALNTWRSSSRATGDAKNWTDDFWMTGEAWGYGMELGSSYHTQGGFDSMINFSFNGAQGGTGRTPTTSDWSNYANSINNSPYNLLSYVSSHDTGLCRPSDMKHLGTMLVLLPGGVQIFYGDETARPSVDGKGDSDMTTRGDMNWDAINGDVANHWKKVGTFRKNHVAVGAGKQTDLGSDTYGRVYNGDKVVIKINASGSTSVNVSGIFADGTAVRNAYDGATGTVSGGKVTFTATNGVILIEEAN